MIDLYGNRANETYTYRRVKWPSLQESTDLGNVVRGSFELSAFSDLKATCQFDFEGGEAPGTNDLIRVYYSFDDDHGEHAEFCIGTFFVGYSDTRNRGDYDGADCTIQESGTVDGWSVLKVLQDYTMGYAYTVASGVNAISRAVTLMQNRNLTVRADASSYTLTSDHTFDPEDTLLTVVNWLCTTAGCQAPYPDPYGVVRIDRYVDPSERAVVAEFANDSNSIMYPVVTVENDWQSTPNVWKLYYSTDSLAMHAQARNTTGNKASLDARGGRELSKAEMVNELSGATSSAMLTNLKGMAKKKLLDNSQEIERVTLSHPYIPLSANDAVSIQYADRYWSGNVQNIRGELKPSTKCETTIRRFVPATITVTTSGSIDWEEA